MKVARLVAAVGRVARGRVEVLLVAKEARKGLAMLDLRTHHSSNVILQVLARQPTPPKVSLKVHPLNLLKVNLPKPLLLKM